MNHYLFFCRRKGVIEDGFVVRIDEGLKMPAGTDIHPTPLIDDIICMDDHEKPAFKKWAEGKTEDVCVTNNGKCIWRYDRQFLVRELVSVYILVPQGSLDDVGLIEKRIEEYNNKYPTKQKE